MSKKIEDIKGDYTMTNLHGVDLKKCLLEPFCRTFEKSFQDGEFENFFVVLRELP